MFRAIGGLTLINGLAQVAQLVVQPILASLYSPDKFGDFAQISFVATILVILGALQVNNFVVLKKNYEIKLVLVAATIYAILFTGLASVVVSRFSNEIFGDQLATDEVVITAALVLFGSVGCFLRGVLTATADFKCLMKYSIARAMVLIIVQLTFGFAGYQDGLLYGAVIGEVFAVALCGYSWLKVFFSISYRQVLVSAKNTFIAEKEFFITGTAQELVSVAAFMLPLYMVARVFGAENGGQFAMAHKLAWAPILLLTQSITPVLMAYISRPDIKFDQSNSLFDLRKNLSGFGIVALLSVACVGYLFRLIFGDAWLTAAELCSYLGVFSASFLSSLPYRLCLRVMNKQRMQLYVDLVNLISIAAVFYLYGAADIFFTVRAIVFIGVLQNFSMIFIARRCIKVGRK